MRQGLKASPRTCKHSHYRLSAIEGVSNLKVSAIERDKETQLTGCVINLFLRPGREIDLQKQATEQVLPNTDKR